jgi:hypothetical protein
VTAYLSDPTDESFGQPWSSVTVNFGSPLQQDATVFLDTNNMGEAMLSKISQLGAFTGQFMRSGFCSYPAFTFDTEVMGNMRDLNEFVSADHSSLAEMRFFGVRLMSFSISAWRTTLPLPSESWLRALS